MTDIIIWPGWIAGAAIGLFVIAMFWLTGRQLGVSSVYATPFAWISGLSFFSLGEFSQLNNWRLWFVIGIPLGAALAVLTSPDVELGVTLSMGPWYDKVLPEALWAKSVLLFTGGIMIGAGARMAGGCTSGHAISGCSLLNPASLLAAPLFFVGGLITVQMIGYFLT